MDDPDRSSDDQTRADLVNLVDVVGRMRRAQQSYFAGKRQRAEDLGARLSLSRDLEAQVDRLIRHHQPPPGPRLF